MFNQLADSQKTTIEIDAGGHESIQMATIPEEQQQQQQQQHIQPTITRGRRQFKSRKQQSINIEHDDRCDGMPTPPVLSTDDDSSGSGHRRHRFAQLQTDDIDQSKQSTNADLIDTHRVRHQN